MLKLSDKEWKGLRAMCDAVIPAIEKADDPDGYWARKASDMKIAERIVELVSQLSVGEQEKFKKLCRTLSTPLLGLTWLGALKSADRLSLEQRTRLLQRWSKSPLADLRNGFNSLKKLTGFFFYAGLLDGQRNPNWSAINYPGPLKSPPTSDEAFQPLRVPASTQLACDVVIVGSGAGGSVVAAQLAEAGQKVIIVEKGCYLNRKQMTQHEEEMLGQLYDSQAALNAVDGNITVLAGSCLGGGTTINWAGAFRTPDFVLEEWAKEHGNPHFLDPEYQKCFEFIEQRNHIDRQLLRHNPQNQALADGAEALGYLTKIIPRNSRRPEGLDEEFSWKAEGFSPHGDSYGIKQDGLKTFLSDAVQAGAEILVDTEVRRIDIRDGQARGVSAVTKDELGRPVEVKIRANRVVVAAGAIHTPALLLRSGLQHPEIGRNLYLHPTTAVSGLYPHPVESWYGPMMSAVCDEFIQLDGNHGFKIETPPAHPGLMATAMSWESGEQYKREMLDISRVASFIVLTRDKIGGQVRLDKKQQAEIRYRVSDYDRKHMLRGIGEAVRIHAAAGAERVSILHNGALHFDPKQQQLSDFLPQIDKLSWTLNRYFLASAHQMGTCRMGASAERHPLQPDGQLREVRHLYVADTSAFPSASGANPMLSAQALAYYIAQQIKAGLKIAV